MSQSFSVENLLDQKTPESGFIIDKSYPNGSRYYGTGNFKRYTLPKLCLCGHGYCIRAGVPGCCEAIDFIQNNIPNSLTTLTSASITNHESTPRSTLMYNNPSRNLRNSVQITQNQDIPNLSRKLSEDLNLSQETIKKIRNQSNGSVYLQPPRNGFMSTSNAAPSTSTKSPKRNQKSYDHRNQTSTNNRSSVQGNNPSINVNMPIVNASCSSEFFSLHVPNSTNVGTPVTSTAGQSHSSTDKNTLFADWRRHFLEQHLAALPRNTILNSEPVISVTENGPVSIKNEVFPLHVPNSTNVGAPVTSTASQNHSSTDRNTGEDRDWRRQFLEQHLAVLQRNAVLLSEPAISVAEKVPVSIQNAAWYNRHPVIGGAAVKQEFSAENSTTQKRKRTTFTSTQLLTLENVFAHEGPYLSRLQRIQLSTQLNLTETQVKVWFQNRRVRAKEINGTKRERKINLIAMKVKKEAPSSSGKPLPSSPPWFPNSSDSDGSNGPSNPNPLI